MFDYIIVGAGFAGTVLAERLATRLDKKVLIIEKRNHIGGNCYDYMDENGIIVHKYGPHLFHTDNQKVFQYLSKFTEWNVYNHEVLAYIDGRNVEIPFNLNSLYKVFPVSLAQRLEDKLLANFEYNSKVPILELQRSDDPDLKFLSGFVYDKIFVNYTAKQWEMKPEEIDTAVTDRVPVFIGKDNRYFNDKYQVIPKNGYTKLFENMIRHKNIKLMLNTDFKEVMKITDDGFEFFGTPYKGKVIFTGQIDELFNELYGELPYRSLELKLETVEQEWFQETTTVNYPNNYDFTRITEFKHIHPVKTAKTTILKEYPQKHVKGNTIPYYPVFTDENQQRYVQYKQYATKYENLMLVGRLAEYKYYDMDDIVDAALNMFEAMCNE